MQTKQWFQKKNSVLTEKNVSLKVVKAVNITEMNEPTYLNKERLFSEYHRELRAWKNIVAEGIKCNVAVDEVIKDNERYHGRALGFLVALKCLPFSVMSDAEIEVLRQELVQVMHITTNLIEVYKNE